MIDDIIRRLRDKRWRMSHLYKIKNKDGKVVTFKPNEAQQYLYDNRHNRNIVPKARQRGISTGILIDYLDSVLFTPYQKAATLAHRESDAMKLFSSKVKFPYDNIDPYLKPFIPEKTRETTSILEFSNGSIISAETMVRSDTLNFLHVSELAKLYMQQPSRAEEVRTGAFPAAERGITDVESTMEGRYGLMYELCEKAKALHDMGTPLTPKDFKFFFFPWYGCADYVMDTPVDIDKDSAEYFDKLKDTLGISLSDRQKWWYIKESEIQGDSMKQEYPSSYEESTEVSGESMFFGSQIIKARKENRICNVRYDPNVLVYAAFDIGHSDSTAIWTYQLVGLERHFIDYYERNGELPSHYDQWLQALPYRVRKIGMPHDAKARTLGSPKSVADIFRQDFFYEVDILKRDDHEIHGINDARGAFSQCWFDKNNCKRGIECLDKFHKQFDSVHSCYRTSSVHDEYSDGAKAFIYSIQHGNLMKNRSSGMTLEQYKAYKKAHRRVI